ncbi:MAG: major capsid protein [Candidatus Krumholzibacteria bacterium]|nr:major capsid protein [Candidatus Krumholzibacteria bacterium]
MDPLFPTIPDDLSSLSDDDLSALKAEHEVALDKIEAEDAEYTAGYTGAEIIEALAAGAEQVKAIRAEQDRRVQEHEAYQAEKTRLAAEARGLLTTETVEDDDVDADATPEPLAADTVEAVETVEEIPVVEEPVAVVAAAVAPTYRRAPAASTPIRVIDENPMPVLVAAAGVPGNAVRAGQPLDRDTFAKALIEVAKRLGRPSKNDNGNLEKHLVASMHMPYPEDRILRSRDYDGNLEKLQNVGSPFLGKKGQEALLASGGLCAPLEPFYTQPNLSTAARPVRDALPNFMAERGGVSVPTPSTIGDITTAISVIEEADDALGGTYATKSCQDLSCPSWTDVAVTVIAHCREYGNLNAMAWPEGIAHENDITMAAQSRAADGYLLDRLTTLSLVNTYAVGYGSLSVVIGGLLQAKASTISVLRMNPGTRFRALLPAWAADNLAWDLVNSQFGRFEIGPDGVAGLLGRYNIDVSWYLDTATGDGQVFSDEVTSTALDRFPGEIDAYVFPEGTFLHIDSGDLELGIVRDSTLNSLNDFQVFGETFENVARIGPAQAAKKIAFTACPTGEVAAPNGTAITCS